MISSKRSAIFILYLSVILIISQACSQSPNTPEPIPEETASADLMDETSSDDETGDVEDALDDQTGPGGREAMVFVVDPDYKPIPNAVIGAGGKYTDISGVFYGEVAVNASGWVPVQAHGYVANYAKPSPYSGDYDLFFVTLAPVETTSHYQAASSSKLQIGESEAPRLELELGPDAFNEEEGMLGLTELDPREFCMDDALAELDNPYGAILTFDISAWTLDGVPLNLAENKTALVSIQDTEHDVNDLILQSFDPESGSWIEQQGACSRLNEETIQCTLNHFSIHNFMDKNLESWQMETQEIIDFRNQYFAIGKIFKSGEDDGTLDQEAAQQAADHFQKLVEAAREFAKKNPNETGKAMLVFTAQLAQLSGIEGSKAIADELIKEAQDLTAELAKKLAEKADCGHTDEIMHLIDQGMRLGGSAATAANDLMKKVSDQLNNCVIWKGDIHYMFFLLDEFPELEGHWQLQSSGQTWHEFHSITIGINPITGKVSGTSKVRVTMNEAPYMTVIGGGDCGADKHYIDVEVNPGVGFTTLNFDGTYKNQTWSIGPLQEGEYSPATLFMHQHGLFGCPKQTMELSNTQMFTYRSQLLHGFFGTPQPPTLEEMLNNGILRKTADGFEFIRGSEDIYYTSGINRAPIIPVDHAHLTWSFKRVSTTTMEQ